MIDLKKDKYIIVEIIPTALTKDKGDIVQLSALKLEGIKLLERFDYRLDEDKVAIKEFINMCSYDKESFTYLPTTNAILKAFENFVEDLPIFILDNTYTRNFLMGFKNIESIAPYFHLDYSDDIMEILISKYHLEPTNYIVDLLYEAILHEID